MFPPSVLSVSTISPPVSSAFCESSLWDVNRTWNTPTPSFTPCFTSTVLSYLPSLLLLLLTPLDVITYCTSGARKIPWGLGIISRVTLTSLILLLSVAQLSVCVSLPSLPTSLVVGLGVQVLGLLLSLGLTLAARYYGQVTSGPQFCYWTIFSLCQGLTIGSNILGPEQSDNSLLPILSSISLGLSITVFFLSWFSDSPPVYADLNSYSPDNPSPKHTSSSISRLLYGWFDRMILTGWRKPLDQEDLWGLDWDLAYRGIVPRYESLLWPAPGSPGRISIFLPLVQCFGHYYLLAGLFQLGYIGLSLSSPQVIDLFITFVSESEYVWKGWLYTALLAGISIAQGVCDTRYWNGMEILSQRVFTALEAVIYKKSLTLSSEGRNQYTAGQVVNLIAVDCEKVKEAVKFITFMWSAPLQVGLSIYFIWNLLGPAVLVGLAVLFLCLPFNGIIWYIMDIYQKRQMHQKDVRVNLVNEILNGIKVLKMYAWEQPFEKMIGDIRKAEISALKGFQYLEGTQYLMWNCAPFLVAVGSFAAFVLIDPENNVLDSRTAFVSLSLFNTLQGPFFLLPYGIVCIIQGGVSIARINKFLNAEEIDPTSISRDSLPAQVTVRNATFSWGEGMKSLPVLRNINMEISEGSLVAVVGKVGSGKSSLLSSLLGEMNRLTGLANVRGEVAYVAQQAWMRNMSLKDNILFDKTYSDKLYQKVLESCALEADLAQLPAGDRTEIGEKGINMSGGQKQRINLARAVYANKDLYLLDDPLSAVDAHVGKHIFEQVLGPKGVLRKKTRILVTHGIGFLPQMDKILVLKDGQISETGSYSELLERKGDFAEFILEQLKEATEEEASEEEQEEAWKSLEQSFGKEEIARKRKNIEKRSKVQRTNSIGGLSEGSSVPVSVIRTNIYSESKVDESQSKIPNKGSLVEDEYMEVDGVKIQIYLYYAKAVGLGILCLGLLSYFLMQLFSASSNILLAAWSDDRTADTDISRRNFYLTTYGVLGGLQSLSIFAAIIIMTMGTVKASVRLHDTLLKNILRAPMSFFDTTPTGRIVNRFSRDIDEIDIALPVHIKDILNQLFVVLGLICILTYVFPIILAAILPLILIFMLIQSAYLRSSRQLKRLMAVNRSPLNSHIEESLTGAPTIRAFNHQDQFTRENEQLLDRFQQSQYPELMSNGWLFLRLQVVGTFLVLSSAIIIVTMRESIASGLVGLCLSYTVNCQLSIYMVTRFTAEMEKSIVSVERVKEYQEVDQEAPLHLPSSDPPTTWPLYGNITFDRYSTRYRPGLELVLSQLSCDIHGGEKIGIVGRTGAGKSSITLALFRIVEAAEGSISIDGVNISHLGLTRLRSALTIIPQDPVLFSGSLRFNLDPFNAHSDQELWKALGLAHLGEMVTQLPGGLDHDVAEGGINFSVGQRQLICLVRALLRRTRILVLDEATAAIDLETDDLIQTTIRREFADCTVLTIAHRIKTILDSSRVLVMDAGTVKEFDSPEILLQDKQSAFYKMALESGLV